MKKKVLVNYRIPIESLKDLNNRYEVYYPSKTFLTKVELKKIIPSYHGLLSVFTKDIDKEIIDAAKNLEIISNYGVGFNNIDVETATLKNILVCNTPQSVCEPTAEICIGLIVSLMRNISGCNHEIRTNPDFKWGVMQNLGYSVSGKTLGIIGMGNIGKAVARRAIALGMQIVYHNRNRMIKEDEEKYFATYLSFEELLSQADVLSLNVPLTNKTHHLIGQNEFKKMKKSAYIVNTSRGAVINEQHLVNALKQKEIAGAALDVFEHEPTIHKELLHMNNIVLTAHMGSSTFEARTEVGVEAAQNFIDFWENKKPNNVVNTEVLDKIL